MQAAEAWNKASKEEKAPHVLAAEREKVQYERLCDEYTLRKEAAAAAGEGAMGRHGGAAEVSPAALVLQCMPVIHHLHHFMGKQAVRNIRLVAPHWHLHKLPKILRPRQ